jgi:hypothetical protein
MTGTEKLKPIVIGKSKEPRCFRGKESLPIIYRNNLSSWMTTEIFTEFLQKLNRKMITENRKIAFIIDNCSSHPSIPLSNVKLIFLPPNTTSRLQAMDMGVIHSIKSNYRLKIARKLLVLLETEPNPTVKDIDLYDALIMLKTSWDEVSAETIKNCFIKSGLSFANNESEIEELENESDESIWNELSDRLGLEDIDFEDYVNFDNDIAVEDENIDETIAENELVIEELIDMDQLEDEEIETECEAPVKLNDALNAISQLRKYITQFNGLEKCHDLVNSLENNFFDYRFKSIKQTKITDYFH